VQNDDEAKWPGGELARRLITMMNCEEFERSGLDLDRAEVSREEAAAAHEHVVHCSRCKALLSSWREAKEDLRLLRETTYLDSTPARVAMRLKQELRTLREAGVPRRSITVAGWALAAAAAVAAAVAWVSWHEAGTGKGHTAGADSVDRAAKSVVPDAGMHWAADSDTGAFTRLPASLPSPYENQEIIRVRMQRGALGRFGLPVAQERSTEWVQVDLLIGEDGVPQAVRLHQDQRMGESVQ
jgi:hypothetical protein